VTGFGDDWVVKRLTRSGRRPWALLALGPVLALAAACGSGPSAPAAPSQAVGTKLDGPLKPAISALPLRTSTGATTTLAAYAGKVVVISDSMTLCQESCPLDTTNIVEAARAVNRAGLADKVVFLTISVDPGRDTTARLAAYRKFYAAPGQLPNWVLLTGRAADIDALWKYFGVFWKKVGPDKGATDWMTGKPLTYDVTHSDDVFFVDEHQHERFLISGMAMVRKGTIPSALQSFLNTEGRQNMEHPQAGSWTVDQLLQTVSWLTGRHVAG
ncbi:MAG: SCO family protein, partial [Nocardioidaceae bacterium]